LIDREFGVATAVAAPAVTNCDAPLGPQAPGAHGIGKAVPATTAPENNDKEITPSTDSRIVGNRGGTCIDYSAFIVAKQPSSPNERRANSNRGR
jgi:hypothetical protein